MSEGYFRFLCPHCSEMVATVNPRNNLAHCFCCQKNLDNIDLLLTLDYDFVSAVAARTLAQPIPGSAGQRQVDARSPAHPIGANAHCATIQTRRPSAPKPSPIVLQNSQQFGKQPFATPKPIHP